MICTCPNFCFQHTPLDAGRINNGGVPVSGLIKGLNTPTDAEIIKKQSEKIADLERERDELRERLPQGMEPCKIIFKQCELGHGWLTAANWVQHDCPTCGNATLRAEVQSLTDCLNGASHAVYTAEMYDAKCAEVERLKGQRVTPEMVEQAENEWLASQSSLPMHMLPEYISFMADRLNEMMGGKK